MSEQPAVPAPTILPTPNDYLHRGNIALEARLQERTAAEFAAFFLPHLRRGMRLLDCGCGPGTITLGLAEAVAPGEVVGIDVQPRMVEQASTLAAERGLTNVRFELANLYELPFPDASFDAVFCNQVFQYLREPVQALREWRRLLRPGGVAGVQATDSGSVLRAPSAPLLEQLQELSRRALRHHGGNPFIGRGLRQLLLDAGFARAEASARLECFGTAAATRRHAANQRQFFAGVGRTALEQGWASQETLDAIDAELHAWGERPGAFAAWTHCEAIGWVDD